MRAVRAIRAFFMVFYLMIYIYFENDVVTVFEHTRKESKGRERKRSARASSLTAGDPCTVHEP